MIAMCRIPQAPKDRACCDGLGRIADFKCMASHGPSPSANEPVTDSPWFWLGLFSLAALAALVVIGPKFQRRHARLELQSEVRQQVWRQRVEQSPASNSPATGQPAADAVAMRAGGVWLWPLAAVALAVTSVCWTMLWRQRRSLATVADGA
jgi:hypothetical protein